MAADENPATLAIVKDIYDAVQRLERSQAAVAPTLINLAERVADHETRLRAGERWRYAIPATLMVAATNIVLAVAALKNGAPPS
jgi:hypothetical protein